MRLTALPRSVFYLLLVTFNFGGQLLTNLAGFLIPGYYTLATLFSVSLSKLDDNVQWLAYWVIFGFFNVLESAFNVTYWIPFYYTAKLLLLLWAGLPQFNGAQVIFKSFMQPLLAKYFLNTGAASANLRARVDGLSGGLSGDLGNKAGLGGKVDGMFNKSL